MSASSGPTRPSSNGGSEAGAAALPPRPGKCEFGHCKFWAFSGPGSLGRSQQQPHGCGPVWLGSQSIRLVLLYSDLGRLVVLNLLVLVFDLHLFDKWIGTPGEHVPARGLPAALSGPESRGPDKARADCKAFKPEPSFQHQTARGSLGAEWEI